MATYAQRGTSHNIIYTYQLQTGENKQQWETYSSELDAMQRKAFIEYLQKQKRREDIRAEAIKYKTEREAEAARREAENHAAAEALLKAPDTKEDNSQKTYQEFAEKWLPFQARKRGFSPNTYDNYKGNLRKHILPFFGSKAVSKITAEDIDIFVDHLSKKPRKGVKVDAENPTNTQTLASATVKKCYNILTGSLKTAKKWNYISVIPDTTAPAEKGKKRKAWDLEQILSAIESTGDELLALAIQLMFAGSLRVGETVGVAIKNLDFRDGGLLITQEVQRVSDEALAEISQNEILQVFPKRVKTATSSLILKGPKNEHSIRKIYLPQSLVALISKRMETIQQNKEFFGSQYQDYGLLLCRADGWPIEPKSLNKEFQALQFRLGIEDKIDFYSLRKSGQIHKLRLTNNNVQLVAENGGHTPEVMMAHYNDIFDLEKQELAKLVEQSMYSPQKAETPSEDALVLQKILSNPALLTRVMEQMKTTIQEAV